MLKSFVKLFGGDPNKKTIEEIRPTVAEINSLESQFEALSDEALRAKTDEFRAHIAESIGNVEGLDEKEQFKAQQEALYEILPQAFAAVREASKRTIGLRHFDVQMIGGVILHRGAIAEMRTGEGKTLAATLPTPKVYGPNEGHVLLVGWGSSEGPIREAVDRARAAGDSVSSINIRHISPLPPGLENIFSGFHHIFVVEMNDEGLYGYGQLAALLRARYCDAKIQGINKTDGLTWKVREILDRAKTAVTSGMKKL